jgi:alcohol dehydrogenase (cytochrome c)
MKRTLLLVAAALLLASYRPHAQQVTSDRILKAAEEPQNWLTYSGGYFSQRYSTLKQIDASNVKNLEVKWMLPNQVFGAWQSSPIVVDGIMYLTMRPNDVMAVDARSGRVFWQYSYRNSTDQRVCCGSNNRGVAILGDTLFMATLDAHLVALDARTGRLIWNQEVGDPKLGYSMTLAPLVVKDKVIVGVGGGEYGIRGYLTAHDARTGKELWRTYTVPAPGEKGSETWSGDHWKTGGGSVWVTGSYDAALNLTYWGIGNPGPDWTPGQRPGDNLYTDSVIAMNPDTGEIKWHYQFTPNDGYDYDSVQVPVLADIDVNGTATKAMLWANRNGNFYVLDRTTGKFLIGKPFVKVNWMSGFDANGRPIQTPQGPGMPTYPGNQGGTNWFSPSYSPRTGLFYLSAWVDYASIYRRQEVQYQSGRTFAGAFPTTLTPVPGSPAPGIGRRSPINNWTDAVAHGATIAIDPKTGAEKWRFSQFDVSESGNLTTGSDLLFTGGREGYFYALDARTGAQLWRFTAGGQIVNGPMTYQVDGKQYLTVISGNTMITFGLRD